MMNEGAPSGGESVESRQMGGERRSVPTLSTDDCFVSNFGSKFVGRKFFNSLFLGGDVDDSLNLSINV